MSLRPKYVVVRIVDLHNFLSRNEQKQMMALLEKVRAGRAASKLSTHDTYWPLNLKDHFALGALEHYISLLERYGPNETPQLTTIYEQAVAHREHAVLTYPPGVPPT